MLELGGYSTQYPRVVGVEDGYFKLEWKRKKLGEKTIIAIVAWEGGIIDFKLKRVKIDGLEGTVKFLEGYHELNVEDIAAIMLGGVTFAGFNIIDPTTVYSETKVPVIVVTRGKPNVRKVRRALEDNFEDWKVRWSILENFRKKASRTFLHLGETTLYLQFIGLNVRDTVEIVKSTVVHGGFPEPLRIAKLIASSTSRSLLEFLEHTC